MTVTSTSNRSRVSFTSTRTSSRYRPVVLSARGVFEEILDNDESFQLFCSIGASGELQGGWENGRIAALAPDSQRHLRPRIYRHGADEDKHARIFLSLLRRRGLDTVDVPPSTDYTMILERQGYGLAHEKLRADDTLTERDLIVYLAHSRVTEQRASEQMQLMLKHFADRADIGRAVMTIADDEDRHLAYCNEELLHLSDAGHDGTIRRILRETALAEIRVYRDVSLAVMDHMGRILGWSKAKAAVLGAGIRATYTYERLYGWRRMVRLRMPERRDALGPSRPDRPGPATTGAPVMAEPRPVSRNGQDVASSHSSNVGPARMASGPGSRAPAS
jgi:hypothetical protein